MSHTGMIIGGQHHAQGCLFAHPYRDFEIAVRTSDEPDADGLVQYERHLYVHARVLTDRGDLQFWVPVDWHRCSPTGLRDKVMRAMFEQISGTP